jgi:hypothetical protein
MTSIEFLKSNERRETQAQPANVSVAKNDKDAKTFAELIFAGSGSAEEQNVFSVYRRQDSDHFLSLKM